MITEVKSDGEIFAIHASLGDLKEGTFPSTDPSWSIQLLMMNRRAGHIVAKHTHKKITKTTNMPQEAIVVIKGAILASIFDRSGSLITKQTVSAGECLLIVDGAHEVEVTEDALIYAFKDGPYVEDKIPL